MANQKGKDDNSYDKNARFWVHFECERRKAQHAGKDKKVIVSGVLHEWEEAGEAMRYLRSDGKIGWKPTPRMLDWLKSKGKGHLTLINDILANVMEAEQQTQPRPK